MCGIIGLFAKQKIIENRLGDLLGDMLITMSDRGPDSAGLMRAKPMTVTAASAFAGRTIELYGSPVRMMRKIPQSDV